MRQRVAVLGAGIIGLLTARLLLRRGVRVLLADVRQPGRCASWAGGGIVSPLYPWRYPAPVTALAAGAQEAYAELAAALRRDTGIDPEYTPCGLLMLDPDFPDEAIAWSRRNGRCVIRQDAEGMSYLQSGLSATARQGLWLPEIGNVRNPRLLKALLADIAVHPQLDTRWQASVMLDAGEGGERLLIDGAQQACDAIVVAAGAWSASLLRPFGVDLPVVPVRGQMLQFAPAPGLLRRIVLRDGRYLIPRRDGRILAGSTLEFVGDDPSTTPEARSALQAAAHAMLPALADVGVEAQWAGLRPGSPSGIPFIAQVPGTRVFVNAGHFRNGLVLAPAATRLGVDQVLGERLPAASVHYRLDAPRPNVYL